MKLSIFIYNVFVHEYNVIHYDIYIKDYQWNDTLMK